MGARGTIGLAPLALLLALTATVLHAGTAAAQEIPDQVLPGCGICYPGGYDVNTVGEVTGSVVELQEPAEGPVRFAVAGERDRWVVLASPAWFWKSAKRRPQSGDAVTVRGSKTLGADGMLYLVAQGDATRGRSTGHCPEDRRGTHSGATFTAPASAAAEGGACRSQGQEAAERQKRRRPSLASAAPAGAAALTRQASGGIAEDLRFFRAGDRDLLQHR
jgi:hypothetical protein